MSTVSSVQLSIVSTIYNSESTIEQFVERSEKIARSLVADLFEIILVEDGSSDESLTRALSIQKVHDKIIIVQLSRNYGQHAALLAGLRIANGASVACIDGDCDEDPEWIAKFWKAQNETGADLVIGSLQKIKSSKSYRAGRIAFLKLLDLKVLSNSNETTARLMTRQVANALARNKESKFYFGGSMVELGFHRIYVPVEKNQSVTTRYTFIKRVRQVTTAITSFSTVPLKMLFLWGVIVSIAASTAAVVGLALYLTGVISTGQGWFSLFIITTFFGGNVLLGLGIIGQYVATVVIESKRRPQYHIRRIHRHKQ
jgi:putative glycosyltransferase